MSLVLVAGLVAVLAMVGFSFWSRRPKTPLAELRRLADTGARLLDVRTPGEFQSGHLPGALNIPVDQLEARLREVGSRDKPVIVYCLSGARSMSAARILRAGGFASVHDLGAMSNWRD